MYFCTYKEDKDISALQANLVMAVIKQASLRVKFIASLVGKIISH